MSRKKETQKEREARMWAPPRDERDCSSCAPTQYHIVYRMELKVLLGGGVQIWQCPHCKNIEVLYGG